ncbi:MAG: C39 family peptidase [Chthonomonas sp.]|nr:C39 family peptidase [Chthonomonas sp.]
MHSLLASAAFAFHCNNIVLEPRKDLTWEKNTWVSREIEPGIDWVDVVPSWDVEGSEQGGSIEVLVERQGKRLSFGSWSLAERSSLKDQASEIGKVYTDTFVPAEPGGKVRFLVQMKAGKDGALPRLRWLRLAFSGGPAPLDDWRGPEPIAPLGVPLRAQGDYPGGNVLCSPTSVSMVLNYWANQLGKPLLDADVPEVQACVTDPAWGGTGNWSFNTAFATTRPGLSAYVARLRDVSAIEDWLNKGVPVVASVSYGLLKGKPERDENDGHLVVVVGVDSDGNFIFNDPGKKPIRLVYDRESFQRAWAVSNHTAYLIHPQYWDVPVLP